MRNSRLQDLRPVQGWWRGRLQHLLRLQPSKTEVVLGLACTGHGASLAVATSDGILRSSTLERWAGVKKTLLLAKEEDYDLRNPSSPIDEHIHFCLKYGYGSFPPSRIFEETLSEWLGWFVRGLDLRPSDIDLVVVSEGHFATCGLRLGPRLGEWFPRAWISHSITHHEIHQRQAFWQSGFEEAAVLTLDAAGEALESLGGRTLSGTIALMNAAGGCRTLSHMHFPESSAGLLYEVVTRHAGFRLGDEGKTMGLAPYGEPELLHRLLPRLRLHEDGGFSFFDHKALRILLQDYVPERWPHEEITQRHSNVAYAGQAILEQIVANAFRAALRLSCRKRLVYAGGVALNSVANEIALRAAAPDAFYIAPNPGDAGHALGCALFGAYEIAGWKPLLRELSDYLGPNYSEQDMTEAFRGGVYPVERLEQPEMLLARCIRNGYITARFDGPAEFGPRALGNRSILATPLLVGMKDYLNARVKHRETFRPFAPAVLEECASKWFELQGPSRYMLRVVPVRAIVRETIPAVVHVDGSCRVQTVSRDSNPGFYRVIDAFRSLTGVPIVLNTSFNIAGSPIVETPSDAVRCFASTDIDVLLLGPFLLSKLPLKEYEPPRDEVAPAASTGNP
jgi:carbamoyltransferase